MSDVKWIKITTDIFDDEKMYAIECLQDGYLIELVWFKILCLAGKCNEHGFLVVGNKFPYTDEMLSKVFRMDIGTVERAFKIFQELEMLEIVDNAYMVSNWELHQNTKGLEDIREKARLRQQKHREKQKLLNKTCDNLEESKDDSTNEKSFDYESAWKSTYNIYPKKKNAASAKVEWMDILLKYPKDKHFDIAHDIYLATRNYINRYKEDNKDDDSFKYIPSYDIFLKEDCEYYMSILEKESMND